MDVRVQIGEVGGGDASRRAAIEIDFPQALRRKIRHAWFPGSSCRSTPLLSGSHVKSVNLAVVMRELTRRPTADRDGEDVPAHAIPSLIRDPFRVR